MASRTEKTKFTLKKILNFFRVFTRSAKAVVGLSIIIFFLVVAFFAPLITPYTPLGTDPRSVFLPLSSPFCAPAWLRYLPTYLGGDPTLSETLSGVESPGTPRLKAEGGELEAAGDVKNVTISNSNANFNYSIDGSLATTYTSEGDGNKSVTISFYKDFDFPFSGTPGRILGSVLLLVNGTTNDLNKLNIPVKIFVYLQVENGTKLKLYPPPGYIYDKFTKYWSRSEIPFGFTDIKNSPQLIIDKPLSGPSTFGNWISSVTYASGQQLSFFIDSQSFYIRNIFVYEYGITNPNFQSIYFPKTPGKYRFGIDITFTQDSSVQQGQETTVYLDEFGLVLFGKAFGLLGTNAEAKDLFAQLVYGTRVSLYVGFLSAVLAVGIGLIVGLFAGFLGGVADEASMRINDFMLVLPGLPLMMVLVAILGTGVDVLIIILGLLGWNGFARLVRSQVLSLKERPFVEATRAVGASNTYIILRHMIPNVMPLVYVSLATAVPGAIAAEASLSWLGFFDPNRVSWGRMLHDFEVSGSRTQWWWVVPPGLCIAALAISFILLGFALDDILNPKLRVRR
jgi:peptide/nickel transport system permease protein